ncbi:protein-disulfide reductase DsbD [Stappia sp.]|uniref:protein-disulfide reductase DsbD n=1 Tax=Stappia sp. TaxID=1870903 RepID=UPI0032D9A5D6
MKTVLFAAWALVALALPPVAGPASASPGVPLPVSEAFQLEVTRDRDGALVFSWDIAPGYYLYREHLGARQDDTDLPLTTPPGTAKDDPTFGSMEVYYDSATATLATPVFGTLDLTFQGCQDDGLCYAPEIRHVDAQTLEVSAPDSFGGAPAALGEGPQIAWTTGGETASAPSSAPSAAPAGSTSAVSTSGSDFELARTGGLVEGLLARGGVALVLVSFPLFGLLLAFTPCVFPMYPILAGALAREGDTLTAWRGFVLSSIYVVSLATAFGLLGAAAGWSGQNLQMVLQSPVTSGVLAVLFAVLALSMFGVFELQLPNAWTNWVSARTGGLGGSKRSTALLGFTSALIVGPCVTVPLAGALLYIAQTADVALGAAALFGLGLGKGIPLIVMGTLGGQALPRAGAWMEGVKRVFGFGFLATAIWTAAPLLPPGVDLALWAALLIAVASFAFSAALPNATALASLRALGGLALVYGVILLVGASAGGTDPLKPLAPLAQRGGATAPGSAEDLRFAATGSIPDLQARLAAAKGERPTMVYFTADWCVTCRTIERSVFPDPQVKRSLAAFQLVKADLSDFDAENAALMRTLQVAGPPTMIFFDAAGREAADTRLVGTVTVDTLTRSARTTERL